MLFFFFRPRDFQNLTDFLKKIVIRIKTQDGRSEQGYCPLENLFEKPHSHIENIVQDTEEKNYAPLCDYVVKYIKLSVTFTFHH